MIAKERFGSRDMTYSVWHREWTDLYLGDRAASIDQIDLDWMEFCHRCWYPLALFELEQDRDQDKKVAVITARLAAMARIPSAVVFYRKTGGPGQIARFRVRTLTPQPRADVLLAPSTYAEWLLSIHRSHLDICQGSNGTREQVRPSFPAWPA